MMSGVIDGRPEGTRPDGLWLWQEMIITDLPYGRSDRSGATQSISGYFFVSAEALNIEGPTLVNRWRWPPIAL